MSISKDKIGALCFLVLSVVYGYYTGEIKMLPGDEMEPFNAQTMPKALAWMTGIVSFLLLVLPDRQKGDDFIAAFRGLHWGKTFALMGMMVFYSLSLAPAGFLVSTIVFLAGCIFILGERRWKVIIGTAFSVPVVFWFILTRMLDIYLAPGEWFYMIGTGG